MKRPCDVLRGFTFYTNMKQIQEWNPQTSKWKSAIEKGLKIDLEGSETILYLGASSGTTVSQLSIRTKGTIFAVEKSARMAIPLVKFAEGATNVIPLFCDARDINYIKEKMNGERIDILFCDIPSRDQVALLEHAASLVTQDCKIYLSLKTQSISQKNPEVVMKHVKKELEKTFVVKEVVSLEPFQKKHYFFVLEKK